MVPQGGERLTEPAASEKLVSQRSHSWIRNRQNISAQHEKILEQKTT